MHRAAFTLIELILVLALLAMMVALVVPRLARSSRGRTLDLEAEHFVALTEYARTEAVSHGVEMAVYVETQTQRFGLEPASGTSGVEVRKDYTLQEDLHFEEIKTTSKKEGRVITFNPAGTPEPSSIEAIVITDRQGESRTIQRQSDGWGYEVAKEETK